jgi:peptidase E
VGGQAPRRRILAMGGGGFSSSVRDGPLEDHLLSLARRSEPRICLLPTASGDPEEQIRRFYGAFGPRSCRPSHVSLFRLGTHPVPLRDELLAQDILYVGGGSLLNLLAIWAAHGIDTILREAWESGVVLCGVSAGSMCWFEEGITKSHGAPRVARGLGFLSGSNCVHWDSEPERRPVYRAALRAGMRPGFAVDDGVGLLFEGTELAEVVTCRPDAGARLLAAVAGELEEQPLERLPLEPVNDERADLPLSIAEYREAKRRRAASGR